MVLLQNWQTYDQQSVPYRAFETTEGSMSTLQSFSEIGHDRSDISDPLHDGTEPFKRRGIGRLQEHVYDAVTLFNNFELSTRAKEKLPQPCFSLRGRRMLIEQAIERKVLLGLRRSLAGSLVECVGMRLGLKYLQG